jgi:hypothetical protein
MYQFKTFEGLVFTTEYSPLEISKFHHFDAFDVDKQSRVIWTYEVDFQTFEYVLQNHFNH